MDLSQKRTANENPSSIVYERKFDTALRNSFYVQFKKKIRNLGEIPLDIKENNRLCSKIIDRRLRKFKQADCFIENIVRENHPDIPIVQESTHYAKFLVMILKKNTFFSGISNEIKKINRVSKLASSNLKIQLGYCVKQNFLPSGNIIRKKINSNLICNNNFPHIMYNLLHVSNKLSHIVDLSNRIYSPKFRSCKLSKFRDLVKKMCMYHIEVMNVTFYWSESLTYIVFSDKIFCAPRAILLMFHNKICDLLSVLFYCLNAESVALKPRAFDVTIDFVKELCSIIMKYGNKGYSILKVLEGLCIAETLMETENWINDNFLNNIVNDLLESTEFDYMSSDLRNIYKESGVILRHDLSCLSKIVGHPYVDIDEGAKSLHKKVTEPVHINMFKVHKCVNYFKQDYIKKHIQRHRKWPPCIIEDMYAPRGIRMALLYNKDPDDAWIVRKFGRTHIIDYQFVTLQQNMRMHKLENAIPHLKDKTVTILRSKIIKEYIDHLDVDKDWKETRLLLTYLLHPDLYHNHISYIDKFETCEDLETLANYLIIRVVPKEKELKIAFRGFGAKTYEDRFRTLVQEKNVGLFMGEYSDEQSVTLSELDILRKLDAFRRIKKAYGNHHALYIVVDASSWNNRFSKKAVDDMMLHTICPIFNNNIFSRTHEAFENTFVYISDDDQIYDWEGQRGGIEGLNQYTWMVCYINQMKVAMANFPFKYHVFCKGDDMRIVVLLPEGQYREEDLSTVKNDIVNVISHTCAEFGHKINIEESYGSARYFSFSKSASLDCVELPQVFRKIQKCYGANNAFINTLDDYIASTFSNGHSACKVNPIVIPLYLVALYWSYIYLLNHELYGKCTDDQLIALLLVPSLLGGFPIIYLHNFYVRAESDLLSPYCDLYMYILKKHGQVADTMRTFHYTSLSIPDTLIQLFMDPYALPIPKPPLPSSVLRSFIPKQLKKVCRNERIIELMEAAESDNHDIIVRALSSCNIIRARILSVLYNSSPKALLDQFLRKFESGKSVLELLLIRRSRGTVNKLLLKVLRAEERVQLWRYNHLIDNYVNENRSFTHLITGCPTRSANNIREFCYGKPVFDITMPPLQHQLSFELKEVGLNNEWSRNHHFTFTVDTAPISKTYPNQVIYSSGRFTPFLGYTTRTGNIAPTLHFVEKDPALSKIKDLIEIMEWANISEEDEEGFIVNSNISDMCVKLMRSYTQTPLNILGPFVGKRKSGTVQHHMRSPSFRESIVPNTLSNLYTMVKGESNSHTALRTSNQHYTINLLHCYCYSVWMSFIELEVSPQCHLLDNFWSVTTDCDYCNIPIRERPIVFSQNLINAISLDTLSSVELTNITSSILVKSLDLEGGKIPNIIDDDDILSYDTAVVGVLQHIVDVYYAEWKRVVVRTGGHALGNEALGVMNTLTRTNDRCNVGITELKRIEDNILHDNLVTIVVNMISLENMYKRREEIQTWLMHTPIPNLPWVRVCQWLNDGCRLHRFIKYLEDRTTLSAMGCYYSVIGSARFIGRSCWALCEYIVPYQTLVCFYYYEPEHLNFHLKKVILLYKVSNIQKLLDYHLLSIKNQDVVLSETHPGAIMILSTLLSCYAIDKDEDYLNALSTEILEDVNRERVIDLIDLGMLDKDEFKYWLYEILFDPELRRPYLHITSKILKFVDFIINEDNIGTWVDNIYDLCFDILARRFDNLMSQFTVYYTNLSHCIDIVRNHLNEMLRDMEDNDDDSFIDEEIRENLLLEDNIPDELPYRLVGNHSLQHVQQVMYTPDAIGDNVARNLVNYVNYLPNCVPYLESHAGPFGHGNASPSRFYYLLHAFGFVTPNIENKRVLCLHDGIGNISNLMMCLCTNSDIYFHTTPDDGIPNPLPMAAIDNITHNQLHYKYLMQGYTHLRDRPTIEFYSDMLARVDVCTSDLEHQDYLSYDYELVQMNTLKLVIDISKRTTLSILKYDLRNTELLTKAIFLLRQQYEWVYIVVPQNETHWYYCYVIIFGYQPQYEAYGTINHYNTDDIHRNPYDNNTTHVINNFMITINQHHERTFTSRFHEVTILRAPATYMPLCVLEYIGNHGYNELIEITGGTTHDILQLLAACNGVYRSLEGGRASIITILARHGIDIVKIQQKLTDELILEPRNKKGNILDLNTRCHRLKVLNNLFVLYGIYEFLCDHFTCRFGIRYDPIVIFNSYRRYEDRWMNGRDIHSNPNFNYLNRENPECDQLQVFSSFCRGITVGIRFAFCVILRDRLTSNVTHDHYARNETGDQLVM